MKDAAFVPLLPTDALDLKCMVSYALASITRYMMVKVWRELEYKINASHITFRAHVSKVYTKVEKLSISLYVFHEHHVDNLISMIFLMPSF
jgi:hypothetical protein